ncbi:hypothetical protein [Algicola sagamiensis]|uniref:hypothetical protein n=1 Tax=Algicola sagamiensis TaxID=163869 RepID=UPI000373D8B6|nr:hypothetical protein [Algicola sagamiensis]
MLTNVPKITDHNHIPSEFLLLGTYPNFWEPERDEYFYNFKGTHLVIFSFSTTKKGKYMTNQVELPLEVLPWVTKQLRRFDTPERLGGIPSDKVAETIEFRGEHIGISCGPCVGGPDIPGYTVWNSARKDDFFDTVQDYQLPIPWLDSGFRDFWKSMSDKFFPQGWV